MLFPIIMRLHRLFRFALCLPVLMACGWGLGFLWFLHTASQTPPLPPVTDGIVALTGGASRIETAAHLLEQGKADKMLISGVPASITLADLDHRLGLHLSRFENRITLGRQANSTYGNGMETAAWAQARGVQSLIVVTAGYHMPRALTEISRALPQVQLYPVPVRPPARRGTNDSGSWSMLAGEYTKWLAAQLGLGFLSRGHSVS